jgi:streptogramin lyase
MLSTRSFRRAALGALTAAVIVTSAAVTGAQGAVQTPPGLASPPPPGGELTDLGSPLSSLTVVEGDFGTLPDGRFVAYAAPMGENAQLNVSTVVNGANTSLGTYTMPGASGAPMTAVAPDGRVYIATFYEGHLFRWDPATEQMTDLGRAPGGATYLYGLSIAPDGTVYGGSYPNATVWSYADGAGFTDLGVVIPDALVQYTRTVYDPDHHALWIGTQPTAHLYRLDLTTHELVEVDLADPPKPITSVPDLDYAVGRVFVIWGGWFRVVVADALTEIAFTDVSAGIPYTAYPLSARGVSEAKRGGVYFSSTQSVNGANSVEVVRYDTASDTITRTGANSTVRGALIGYGWTVEGGHDVLYALAGNYSGGGFRLDIDSGQWGRLQFPIAAAPSPLQHVLPIEGGKRVLVNAFLNGNTSVWDVAAGSASPVARFGQVEDWTLADGTVFAGTYPNGALVTAPENGSSITTRAQLKGSDSQIRPLEAVTHDGVVWYGTEPDYGLHGGAIARLDPATGAVDVTRDVVPEHTIAALAFVGDRMFAGSSTTGGTGTDPVPGDANLVEWDPATKTVVQSTVPVAGAGSVNALVEHQAHLYGLADGMLFEADPDTLAVERTLDLGIHDGISVGGGELWFHPNGYLYASVGDAIVAIDPLAFTSRVVVDDSTHRLELSPDGTMWTTLRPEGFQNYIDLARFTPEATPCATPDTREFLTIKGHVTPIRNRFVITGCTLQDLFPATANGTPAWDAAAGPQLDELVRSGGLSASDAAMLRTALR